MKKNLILILIIFLILIISIFIFIRKNEVNNQDNNQIGTEDIIPEEEISDEQQRETMVLLYFKNIDSGELQKENRKIDVKQLSDNPYKILIQLLINGPQDERLESTISKETKINDIYLEGNTVYIDFSKEFIDYHIGGENEEKITIQSIVNTLTELNEVTYVKISIDGDENSGFKDNIIKFKEKFEK